MLQNTRNSHTQISFKWCKVFQNISLIKYSSPILYFHFNLPLAKANPNPNLSLLPCPNPSPATSLFFSEAGSPFSGETLSINYMEGELWLGGGCVVRSQRERQGGLCVRGFNLLFNRAFPLSNCPGMVLRGFVLLKQEGQAKHLKKPGNKTTENMCRTRSMLRKESDSSCSWREVVCSHN